MAHADYNCCLVCDCKLEYIGFHGAETKQDCCLTCGKKLIERDISLTPKGFIAHLKPLNMKEALQFLRVIGYEPCYYTNQVDTYLQERGIVTSKATNGKWGKRLSHRFLTGERD